MSPIVGLTDGPPSFSEIGRLRLGISKAEIAKIGKGPKEIGYFRPDFRPNAVDAFNDFIKFYTDKPTAINFRLPFNDIARCWDANFEVFNKTGMLGKSDGVKWLYLCNNKTGEVKVDRNGKPAEPTGQFDENGNEYLPFDPNVPVYSYKNQKTGEDVPVYAKQTGRLNILIPELGRMNYVQIITHSIYNIARISEQLAGIKHIAENAGTTLPMVPMVIVRQLESISVSYGGRKHMEEHYLLHIEIRPDWAGAQFRLLDSIMPGVAALSARTDFSNLPALPSGNDETEPDEPTGADAEPEVEQPAPVAEFDNAAVEAAMNMQSKDGQRFGDIDLPFLRGMLIKCEAAIKDAQTTDEQRADITQKRDALDLLIRYSTHLAEQNGVQPIV